MAKLAKTIKACNKEISRFKKKIKNMEKRKKMLAGKKNPKKRRKKARRRRRR